MATLHPIRLLDDAVEQPSWCDIQAGRDAEDGQHTRITSAVFDVNQAAKAQSTAFSKLFQAVAAFFSKTPDLHSERHKSRIRQRLTFGHTVTRPSHHQGAP